MLAEQIATLHERIATMTEAVERLEYKLEHYDDHIIPAEAELRQKVFVQK